MWSFRSITPRTTRVNLQRNLCIHFQNGVHTKLVVDAQTRIENVMPLAGLDSNYSVMSRLVRKKILTGRGVDGFVDSTIRSFADGRDDSEVIKWTLCTVTISGFVGPVCPQHLTVDTHRQLYIINDIYWRHTEQLTQCHAPSTSFSLHWCVLTD